MLSIIGFFWIYLAENNLRSWKCPLELKLASSNFKQKRYWWKSVTSILLYFKFSARFSMPHGLCKGKCWMLRRAPSERFRCQQAELHGRGGGSAIKQFQAGKSCWGRFKSREGELSWSWSISPTSYIPGFWLLIGNMHVLGWWYVLILKITRKRWDTRTNCIKIGILKTNSL